MEHRVKTMSGVLTPVATPFRRDFSVDGPRFVGFCQWLISQGSGLAVFGTNSEANSLSLAERRALLDRLLDAGIPPERMMPGVGGCSIAETVELARAAVSSGCGGVLVLPPFFYKGVTDDGLFAYYAQLVDRVDSPDLRLYLYHIPQMSGVPITSTLIERLLDAFPGTVAGIKDSSGDWANTEALLGRFPQLAVFPASEAQLVKALPLGAAGCISATANLQAGRIATLIAAYRTPAFDALHDQVGAVRALLQEYPMIPALKHVIAACSGEAAWRLVRPPLTSLSDAPGRDLLARLTQLGFEMPELAAASI